MDAASRTAGEIRLPVAGQVIVQATSGTPIVIDLAASGAPSSNSAGFEGSLPATGSRSEAVSTSGGGTVQTITPLQPAGYVGRWIDVFADGADLGLVAGPTNASVTGGNVPALATTGNAGTAGCCMRIPNGTYRTYYVTPDTRFLGIVAAAAANVRIALSSRAG